MSDATNTPTTTTDAATAAKPDPEWIKTAHRLDRPKTDVRYKPESHGALDGVLIWQGEVEAFQSGDIYHEYAIRDASGVVFAVTERVGLRDLRAVRCGSRVFIKPLGQVELKSGNKMWRFQLHAEQLAPAAPTAKPAAATANQSTAAGAGQPDGGDIPF